MPATLSKAIGTAIGTVKAKLSPSAAREQALEGAKHDALLFYRSCVKAEALCENYDGLEAGLMMAKLGYSDEQWNRDVLSMQDELSLKSDAEYDVQLEKLDKDIAGRLVRKIELSEDFATLLSTQLRAPSHRRKLFDFPKYYQEMLNRNAAIDDKRRALFTEQKTAKEFRCKNPRLFSHDLTAASECKLPAVRLGEASHQMFKPCDRGAAAIIVRSPS